MCRGVCRVFLPFSVSFSTPTLLLLLDFVLLLLHLVIDSTTSFFKFTMSTSSIIHGCLHLDNSKMISQTKLHVATVEIPARSRPLHALSPLTQTRM